MARRQAYVPPPWNTPPQTFVEPSRAEESLTVLPSGSEYDPTSGNFTTSILQTLVAGNGNFVALRLRHPLNTQRLAIVTHIDFLFEGGDRDVEITKGSSTSNLTNGVSIRSRKRQTMTSSLSASFQGNLGVSSGTRIRPFVSKRDWQNYESPIVIEEGTFIEVVMADVASIAGEAFSADIDWTELLARVVP